MSVEERRGEGVRGLGRNGWSKVSVLKRRLGRAKIGSGAIHIAGQSIASPVPEAMARLGIAVVPQGRRLFSGLSVKDNLMLGRLKRSGRDSNGWTDEEIFKVFPRLKERYKVDA